MPAAIEIDRLNRISGPFRPGERTGVAATNAPQRRLDR